MDQIIENENLRFGRQRFYIGKTKIKDNAQKEKIKVKEKFKEKINVIKEIILDKKDLEQKYESEKTKNIKNKEHEIIPEEIKNVKGDNQKYNEPGPVGAECPLMPKNNINVKKKEHFKEKFNKIKETYENYVSKINNFKNKEKGRVDIYSSVQNTPWQESPVMLEGNNLIMPTRGINTKNNNKPLSYGGYNGNYNQHELIPMPGKDYNDGYSRFDSVNKGTNQELNDFSLNGSNNANGFGGEHFGKPENKINDEEFDDKKFYDNNLEDDKSFGNKFKDNDDNYDFGTVDGPPSPFVTGALPNYLMHHIGKFVRVEFILGMQAYMDRNGILHEIGDNYIVLKELGTNQLTVCDLYSIKFVNIFDIDPLVLKNINDNAQNLVVPPKNARLLVGDER